ncbi:MAG: ribosome maturation factor RimM [Clostridiales bacterium]|jgi:16S rRNA processing protein RimM|nr:ribosome maturation factor RimM [Clostridiales bacterium]
MSDFFEIGKITGAHGVKGEVRVFPLTFNPKRFKLLNEVDISMGETAPPVEKSSYEKPQSFTQNQLNHEPAQNFKLKIEQVRFHKQFVILKFYGMDTANSVLHLKGGTIIIPRTAALPLDADEYYLADLYGIDVETADGNYLGQITDIITTGANDVYAVQKKGEKEILIPAIKQCILSVDLISKKMTVNLLEGLV